MHIRNPNYTILIGPNSRVLINTSLVFWLVIVESHLLVGIGTNGGIVPSSNWTGQVPAHWLKDNPRNSFLRVSSAKRTQHRRLGSSVCDFSLKCHVWVSPLPALAAELWLWIWAQFTMRCPSWQVSSFSRSISVNKFVKYLEQLLKPCKYYKSTC